MNMYGLGREREGKGYISFKSALPMRSERVLRMQHMADKFNINPA